MSCKGGLKPHPFEVNMHNNLHILGYASGLAGALPGSGKGPLVLKQSQAMAALNQQGIQLHWHALFSPSQTETQNITQAVKQLSDALAAETQKIIKNDHFFLVFGGDHTSAIGTWSGAAQAMKPKGDIGLIWIDAHMDSHTPETSLSGHLHGMPLACLLGYGDQSLTSIAKFTPALKPENVCLIGVRSFELGEAAFLKKMNVRIFFIEEVLERGLAAVLAEAKKIVSQHTIGYGITLDIDSIDPQDAPGTGVAEPNGLRAAELCPALTIFADDPHFIGMEIAEFDPECDHNHKTENLIPVIISAATLGRFTL
ncbi:MAG: arginase [Gammaproteobacteria bacterium]|nr:arginase [Gammaproteobacteria bacterium]